jgi:hypothetical protein
MSTRGCSSACRFGFPSRPFTSANFAFIQHGRPLHNITKAPTASGRSRSGPESHGYAIIGHHELFLARMASVLK